MKSVWITTMILATFFVAFTVAVGPDDVNPDPNLPLPPSAANCSGWSYNRTDNAWAEICAAYLLCSPEYGLSQSPINIISNSTSNYAFIGPLSFTDLTAEVEFENTGHVLEVVPKAGAPDPLTRLQINGGPLFSDLYNLTQFHVHTPSEHTLNGVQYEAEFHFVHFHAATSGYAVIAQFFGVGERNDWLDSFLNGSIPTMAGQERPTVAGTIEPYQNLLDDNGTFSYWYYSGSLTTPPCTQNVKWFISHIVSTASEDQIAALQSGVFARRNARGIQPLNGRTVFNVSGQQIQVASPVPPCSSSISPTPTPLPSPTPSTCSDSDDEDISINFYFADILNGA